MIIQHFHRQASFHARLNGQKGEHNSGEGTPTGGEISSFIIYFVCICFLLLDGALHRFAPLPNYGCSNCSQTKLVALELGGCHHLLFVPLRSISMYLVPCSSVGVATSNLPVPVPTRCTELR